MLPREEAIAAIKHAIEKTYGRRGESVVQKNFAAVDASLDHLHEVKVPAEVSSSFDMRPPVPSQAPAFVRDVLARIIEGEGDSLPVSAMPNDGTFPTATAQWEKRNIALEIPVWDENLCIQCGKCVLVCPHAVIRAKIYDPALLEKAPATFKSAAARWKEFKEMKYTLQVAPEDCTGCALCVEICPVKSKSEAKHKAINMAAQVPLREAERAELGFLPGDSGSRPPHAQPGPGERRPVAATPVRILRRLRGLRRNPLHQADDAVVRRSRADWQRHGLLVDLRRQPAHHALRRQPRRPRPHLVELAV